MIEAMKQALEALENNRQTHHYCEDTWYSCPKHEDGCANDAEGNECNCGADKANVEIDAAITSLRQAIAEAEKQETDTLAYREAARLAEWLFKKHYAHEEHYASGRVVWGLCDTTAGVISQIDNMVCQLVKAEKHEVSQEPVALAWDEGYRSGINDERMSEANIGIAGFGAKVEPARNNPYRTRPQPKRKPLTVEQLREHWQVAKVLDMTDAEINFADYVLIARDIEALYGIKEDT